MGRRKVKRETPQRKTAIVPMDMLFTCPFCNHEKSCEVKMDQHRKIAKISCRICSEDFQTNINMLSEPIDVYNDWIDACDAIN
ncbi:transcription elongation factor 1 homolog [Bombus pyrosoma]|uniref:transcription elongation factor 1 homolog n=1 Tax=Bombus pyrosoma TaxID=396416 RepID=UPI001CB94B7C|nr:transcription elongation factor 1 homolog [Bombus pyrosoma]XP_043605480.1 transcription elongation factor 1 homolog [Bombus pyrosoma]